MRWFVLLIFVALCPLLPTARPPAFDHTLLATALHEHVEDGRIDYPGIREDGRFEQYIERLGSVDIEQDSDTAQMALLINAYNAFAIKGVLRHWPIGNVKEDIDDFFTERVYTLAGQLHSLDEIEDKLLAFKDARLHFALTCASSSCPQLEAAPYLAEGLDERLDNETREFLNDPKRGVSYDRETNVLWLPRYFLWFGGDFVEPESTTSLFQRVKAYLAPRTSVLPFILPYLPEQLIAEIQERQPDIQFKEYDWSLNQKTPPSGDGGIDD